MAGNHVIGGTTVDDAHPLAVEEQGGGAGLITTPTHTVLGVTAASQVALAANANRLTALFINDGALPIYLMKGAAAVANQGVRINANGGWHVISRPTGNLYLGEIYAISTAAGPTNLLIEEGV